jgi:hypothetical protein
MQSMFRIHGILAAMLDSFFSAYDNYGSNQYNNGKSSNFITQEDPV